MTNFLRRYLDPMSNVIPYTLGVLGLIVLALLASCAGNGQDGPGRTDLYIAVALETAVGTLVSLEATGTLPAEGADFIDATLAYGAKACGILQDPAPDPAAKRLALTTELADERIGFDRAFAALAGANLDRDVLLVVLPAINGARAAVRIALTMEVDPADYAQACISVEGLRASWDVQRPTA